MRARAKRDPPRGAADHALRQGRRLLHLPAQGEIGEDRTERAIVGGDNPGGAIFRRREARRFGARGDIGQGIERRALSERIGRAVHVERDEQAGADAARNIGALVESEIAVVLARQRHADPAALFEQVGEFRAHRQRKLFFDQRARHAGRARVTPAVARIDQHDRAAGNACLADADVAHRIGHRDRQPAAPRLPDQRRAIGSRAAGAPPPRQQEQDHRHCGHPRHLIFPLQPQWLRPPTRATPYHGQ